MPDSVSAVICNYNCAQFISASIESVLTQEIRPIEILVVDDGSTDGSRAEAEHYLGKIEWIPMPHGGQAAALNAALARCRGQWIAFLESDDLWLPEKLKVILDCAREDPGLAAIQHSMNQVDIGLEPLPTQLGTDSRQTLDDFLKGRAWLTGMSALTARREMLEDLLPLPADLITCVDEYLQPRLLLRGPTQHLARPLGLRRVHGRNFYAGAREDPKRLESYISLRSVLNAHLEAFLKEHGLALEPGNARKRQAQGLELELLWHRSQGSWRQALGDWREILGLYGLRPYTFFKAFTLALALASPPFYLWLSRAYENQAWLPSLRAALFPD